jgi:hypothetical protein
MFAYNMDRHLVDFSQLTQHLIEDTYLRNYIAAFKSVKVSLELWSDLTILEPKDFPNLKLIFETHYANELGFLIVSSAAPMV